MTNTVAGALVTLLGLLIMLGVALNWQIIMRPSRLLNRLAGEKLARPVYIAIGFVVVLLGIGRLIGASWLKR